ncbi:hypothetical protein LVD17_13840 [Fulvivirga ulvae]|uniref:hypothetical protein n=1 Tax=Fulvivirga ulvae TaxID=2904245 RepID=UPI001F1EAE1F|nr:hypothetical protein [Fulvivirga ulvae]UII34889.1 hypothetical protein LVD17_13840 [Fulvivirga ulvae]
MKKEAWQDPTQVLSKLANALDITTDYLMSGSADEVAEGNISDKELLSLYKKVNNLSNEKKKLVKEFLGAFVLQSDLQEKLAH